MSLKPEAILALAAYFKEGTSVVTEARRLVSEGEHDVRCALQVAGVLTVGRNWQQTPTPRLSGLQVLTTFVACLVSEGTMNKTQALALAERAMEVALREPMTEEEMGKSEDPLVREMVRTKAQIQKRICAHLPKEDRFGQVKFNGLAEEANPDEHFAQAVIT